MRRKPLLLASLVLGLLALAGCSSAELGVHLVKTIGDDPEAAPAPPPAPAGGIHYKLGLPYQVSGDWYYPDYDPYYDRTGIASWYGPQFHGRLTANGERFDMNEVSAAHPTLPLPSRVRVTNLENGRALTVRVNDRGPFIDGREIDLSRRAAQLLGFYRKGLARVRVQYLGLERLRPDVPVPAELPFDLHAARAPPPVAFKPRRPSSSAIAEALPPEKPGRTAGAPTPEPQESRRNDERAGRYLVEAAVLEGRDAADRLVARMRPFGAVVVEPERRGGRLVYAVRIGPVDSDAEAASILAELTRAGVTDSHIVAAGYR